MFLSQSARFIKDNPHLTQREPAWGFYIIRPSALADDTRWAPAMTRLRERILEPFHNRNEDDPKTSKGPSNADLTSFITDTLMMPVLDLPWPHQTV
ncbi:hypothetical protein NLG97_g10045 [Lecanicillium saksenae]|uniref:Uncharacterized protein n=1 Tax=Lecanicillium saksenae TaxID=468837 RepID=A0ACC1QGA7_9HYPO|nr:hypothetical protein NLG97_g10045 [Lecanicillium saksenae]